MKLSPRFIAILRRLLLSTAALATAIALLVVVENWRGDRAWAAVQRDLLSRGERLDSAAFQPPPVPDDRNFFKAPQLNRLLYNRPGDSERARLLRETRLADFRAFGQFHGKYKTLADLRAPLRQAGLLTTPDSDQPAADILRALAPLDPLLDEIVAAARERPLAAFEPRATLYDPPQPHADDLFHIAEALSIRAAAALELGRTDAAVADLHALHRLANAFVSTPATLLQVLVSAAIHGLAAGMIADGLSVHRWTDAHLSSFQEQLAAFRPLPRFANATRTERAALLAILDAPPKDLFGPGQPWPWWLFHGWTQQNKVAYAQTLESHILAAIATAPDRLLTARLPPANSTQAPEAHFAFYHVLAKLAVTNIDRMLAHFGITADKLELHNVSWALERHRLARGGVPAQLTDLVPAFLPAPPVSAFDGRPLHYTKLADDRYRLYSLGRNSRDDHGQGDDTTLEPPSGP